MYTSFLAGARSATAYESYDSIHISWEQQIGVPWLQWKILVTQVSCKWWGFDIANCSAAFYF